LSVVSPPYSTPLPADKFSQTAPFYSERRKQELNIEEEKGNLIMSETLGENMFELLLTHSRQVAEDALYFSAPFHS
jgi:hypothetical protein